MVESCKSAACAAWIGRVADVWRANSDIQATWPSVLANAHANDQMALAASVGKYNDPDMLQVGNAGR